MEVSELHVDLPAEDLRERVVRRGLWKLRRDDQDGDSRSLSGRTSSPPVHSLRKVGDADESAVVPIAMSTIVEVADYHSVDLERITDELTTYVTETAPRNRSSSGPSG